MAMTTQDVAIVSFRVGQVTLPISVLTSSKKSFVLSITLYPVSIHGKYGRPGGIRTPNTRFWRPVL
jgi:hypothetical protein